MGITQRDLANAIHVPYQRIPDMVKGRRGVTPGYVLRLAQFFSNSPQFWMNLQFRWDLNFAEQSETKIIETIHPYKQQAATLQGHSERHKESRREDRSRKDISLILVRRLSCERSLK